MLKNLQKSLDTIKSKNNISLICRGLSQTKKDKPCFSTVSLIAIQNSENSELPFLKSEPHRGLKNEEYSTWNIPQIL